MTSENRSRFDAALQATQESINLILQGWQRHEDAIAELNRAKETTEAELAKIHDEIATWHKKINTLLEPMVQRDPNSQQRSTGEPTENTPRETPDKRRRLLEQSAHLWKVLPKRDANAPPPET
jgi:predicted  nucleic acid-binding Zn-ribbon protein